MNFLDAYMIVDNYVAALAREPRMHERWKRISTLQNSKKDICDAFKLFFTHSLFWHVIPNEDMKIYERSLNHIGDFIDDKLVDEDIKIDAILKNRNVFTKLRDNNEKARLEERKKQISSIAAQSMMDGFKSGTELGDFISWMVPAMNAAKDKCKLLSDEEFNAKYFDILGNYVCDVYERIPINRHYDDTEYFWPFNKLYSLSNSPKFERLFLRYKDYISRMYLIQRYNNE